MIPAYLGNRPRGLQCAHPPQLNCQPLDRVVDGGGDAGINHRHILAWFQRDKTTDIPVHDDVEDICLTSMGHGDSGV